MRAFGIVMALFGCGIAFFGFVLISETENVNRITCSPSGTQTSPQTVCYFDGDPNDGLKTSSGGLAVSVVGAGFIAGGLACMAGGGRSATPRTSFAPPVGSGQAAAGGPPPVYGQQHPPTSSAPPSWGPPQQ